MIYMLAGALCFAAFMVAAVPHLIKRALPAKFQRLIHRKIGGFHLIVVVARKACQ